MRGLSPRPWTLGAIAAGLVLCAGTWRFARPLFRSEAGTLAHSPASFVGSGACQSCHPSETEAWSRSNHRSAMREANDSTVLGDFRGASLRVGKFTNAFFKRDGKFFARTDGPDGKLADYEIKYTFGVY